MRLLAVPVVLASLVAPAAADRVDDLQRRVDQLEREVADLKTKLNPKPVGAPMPPRPTLDVTRRYRVPLDDSPSMGPANAPITLVATLQFPELFTHRVWPTLVQLLDENKDVRIVVKNFVVHPQHVASSLAACAAAYQGRLDAMESAIYQASTAPDPTTGASRGLAAVTRDEARELAKTLRLNMKKFDRDVETCTVGYARDTKMLGTHGQNSVPVFWINGRPLQGAMPIEKFNEIITEERDAWAKAKAGGARAETYYTKVTEQKPNPF